MDKLDVKRFVLFLLIIAGLFLPGIAQAASPGPEYKTFLPVSLMPRMQKGIGITDANLQDVGAVGAEWYYTWGQGDLLDPAFVPMDFTGREWYIYEGYAGIVLVFNEPENPGQSNLTPDEAIARYGEFRQRYPQARVILGNVGLWAPVWIQTFQLKMEQAGLPRPYGWGVHGYVEPGITAEQVIQYWDWFRVTIVRPGEQLWITELADVEGRLSELGKLVAWAQAYADRYAIFANRVIEAKGWYPLSWPRPNKLALVDDAGLLTTVGEYYKLIK